MIHFKAKIEHVKKILFYFSKNTSTNYKTQQFFLNFGLVNIWYK